MVVDGPAPALETSSSGIRVAAALEPRKSNTTVEVPLNLFAREAACLAGLGLRTALQGDHCDTRRWILYGEHDSGIDRRQIVGFALVP